MKCTPHVCAGVFEEDPDQIDWAPAKCEIHAALSRNWVVRGEHGYTRTIQAYDLTVYPDGVSDLRSAMRQRNACALTRNLDPDEACDVPVDEADCDQNDDVRTQASCIRMF